MVIKPWHLIAFAGLAVACARPRKDSSGIAGGEAPPEPEEPLEPVRDLYVFVHDAGNIQLAIKAALRIQNASGIKVHVNEYGTVASAVPIYGSDFFCANGLEGQSSQYGIALARNCNVDPEMILVHEMIHHLGVGHLVLPEKGIMNDGRDSPLSKISEADLNALCSVRACSKFQPEV